MALIYANLEAFPIFQEKIEQTLQRLEEEARSREELIEKTASTLNNRVEAAHRAEIAAQRALQDAQYQLAAAEQRTREYNSNLADDESPMTTSAFFYDNVSSQRNNCYYAEAQAANAERALDSFTSYEKHYRQCQEDAVAAYRKLLKRSGDFFQKYMELLIAAKKYTAVASAADGAATVKTDSGAASAYVKTTYTGTVTYTDPVTGTQKTVTMNRTVYRNQNIDPFMVVPAGTRAGNNHPLQCAKTNQELMEEGENPYVLIKDQDGKEILCQVIVHHLTGQENIHGSQYFSGTEKDGSVAEVPTIIHQHNDRVLHIFEGKGSSFRWDKKQDPVTGKRMRVPTEDLKRYNAFRKQYWKDRAAEFRTEMAKKS